MAVSLTVRQGEVRRRSDPGSRMHRVKFALHPPGFCIYPSASVLPLASIFRAVEAGTMELDKARVLVYCAATMAGIVRDVDLEARLDALEAREKAS